MKTIFPDTENFKITEHNLFNEKVYLITPNKFKTEWNKENLIYRSSLWNMNFELISAGHKKFFNWNEKSDIYPEPLNLSDAKAICKIDGSLLICSKHKNNLIIRTRSTIDATNMANGFEIKILSEKYPQAFDNELINQENCSFLYEWVSPLNKIVLDYPEADMYLIGVINHADYTYHTQMALNDLADRFKLKRPKTYTFDTIKNMLNTISELKNEEGICLYYNNDQNIKKIKSIEYLKRHTFKSNCTYKTLLELWIEQKTPCFQSFKNYIEKYYDFECWGMSKTIIQNLYDNFDVIQNNIKEIGCFIEPLKNLSKKEGALKILEVYNKTLYSGVAFTLLHNKEICAETIKKLMLEKQYPETI